LSQGATIRALTRYPRITVNVTYCRR